MTAGQKRKFSRNMQYERSARGIAFLGLSLLAPVVPLLLLLVAVVVIGHMLTGHSHGIVLAGFPFVGLNRRGEDFSSAMDSMGEVVRRPKGLQRGMRLLAAFDFCKFPRKCNPTLDGYQDLIIQPTYDSVAFAAAAAFVTTILFQTPVGAGKTLAQTSMVQAGQLPAPQSLLIDSIQAWVANNTAPVDLQNMLQNVTFELYIGTKPYLQCPLAFIQAGMGGIAYSAAQLGTAAAADVSFASTSNGVPDPRAVFAMGDNPIQLKQGENFKVILTPQTAFNFAAANARPNGNGTSLQIFLNGRLQRSVQ